MALDQEFFIVKLQTDNFRETFQGVLIKNMAKTGEWDGVLKLPGIYGQLDLQCTSDQIGALLEFIQNRSDEAKKNITRSGTKRERLIQLRHAVDQKYVDFLEVTQLLRNSEESGRQTIFLFTPKGTSSRHRIRNGSEIASSLFDDAWGSVYFPVFERPKKGLKWVDFRLGLPGRPNDWLLKAYGHEEEEETTSRDRETISAKDRTYREIRELVIKDVDTVMIVRWRDPDCLEVRIDKTQSTGHAEICRRLEPIKKMLLPAINIDRDMTALSLQSSATKLVKLRNRQTNPKKPAYRIGTLKLIDRKEGTVEFKPLLADHFIDDEPGRTQSLEILLQNSALAAKTAVEWLGDETAPSTFTSPLLVDIEGESYNAISIRSRVNPEVLDYVLTKLRSYS